MMRTTWFEFCVTLPIPFSRRQRLVSFGRRIAVTKLRAWLRVTFDGGKRIHRGLDVVEVD